MLIAVCINLQADVGIQVVGSLLVLYGLFSTWAKYTRRPLPGAWLGALWRRWRRRGVLLNATAPVTPSGSVTATVEAQMIATGSVLAGPDVAARVTQVEAELLALRTEVAERADAEGRAMGEVREHLRRLGADLGSNVDRVNVLVDERARETALDGLGIAAFGVLVGMVGVIRSAWPGICVS